MNDPRVVALLYKIEHGRSVDYREAEPMDHEEAGFRVKIAKQQVRFEFKEHYATEDAARGAIEDYMRAWKFDAGLRGGPNYFKLEFDHAQIEDRNPPPEPGMTKISLHARAGMPTMTATLTVMPPCYPPPPSGIMLTPDVQTMYDRYMGYRQGKELLAGMAYFCLTILELSTKEERNRRKMASKMYGIELGVLDKIGCLSSERGGQQARKASGKDNDLTAQDRHFLEEAIKVVIRRAAEKAHDPDGDLPEISLSDILPV